MRQIKHKKPFILVKWFVRVGVMLTESNGDNDLFRLFFVDRNFPIAELLLQFWRPKYFSIFVELNRFCFRFFFVELIRIQRCERNFCLRQWHVKIFKKISSWLLNRTVHEYTDGVELDLFSINDYSYTISAWNSKCWPWWRMVSERHSSGVTAQRRKSKIDSKGRK